MNITIKLSKALLFCHALMQSPGHLVLSVGTLEVLYVICCPLRKMSSSLTTYKCYEFPTMHTIHSQWTLSIWTSDLHLFMSLATPNDLSEMSSFRATLRFPAQSNHAICTLP